MTILKNTFLIKIFLILALIIGLIFIFVACPGKPYPSSPNTDNVTMAEIAEAVVSGAVTTTTANLTQAMFKPKKENKTFAQIIENLLYPQALAAVSNGVCATIQQSAGSFTTPSSTCTANADNSLTLAWGPCNIALPFGTWSGGETLRLNSNSTTTLTCDGFPAFQAGDSLARVFFIPTSRIANEDSGPVNVLVDTSGNSSISPPTSGWKYPINPEGEFFNFSGTGSRTLFVTGIHLAGQINGYITWDFTVSSANPLAYSPTPPLINISAGNVATGFLYVQDNINQIVVKADFSGAGLTYGNNECGVPSAGSLTTTTLAGTYPGQTLTGFNGVTCGTATVNGTSVNLVHAF